MQTPWGTADVVELIAPGIEWVCTASHGGYRLSPDRNRQVPTAFRALSFAERGQQGWYEEDSDWCMVALTFPDLFSAEELACALEIYRACVQPKLVEVKSIALRLV